MSNIHFPVYVSKENVSDENYKITEINFDNEDKVDKDEVIFSLETSKADIDITAPEDGYLYFEIKLDDELKVGDLLCVISKEKKYPIIFFKNHTDAKKQVASKKGNTQFDTKKTVKISKKAKELMQENNLTTNDFSEFELIRYDDVVSFLDQKNESILNKTDTNIPTYKSNDIVILGAGGHAKMCIDILKRDKRYNIIGVVATPLPSQKKILDIPVIGDQNSLRSLKEHGVKNVILGIGLLNNHSKRIEIYNELKNIGFNIPNIIHPDASVEISAKMGDGNQIMAGAIIGSNVIIENNCIVNSGSIISHDTTLNNNVHITPGAIIAGSVEIGENTLIGMGATILNNIKIGKNVIVTNGTNVIKDIENNKIIKN